MKNIKKTNIPHLTKGLIGSYHYELNIEHAKPMLEKDLIVNSLLGDLTPDTKKQRELKGVLQASLYMYPSQI